jgi:hypothetical protein
VITTPNPLASSKTTGADLAQLVEQLARRADANGDGQVSTSEFSQFLIGLLQPAASSSQSGTTTATGAAGTAAAEAPLPPCPPGWDAGKWANLTHQTPKYVVGRILAKYPPTPDGLTQALPEVQQAIPGTTRVGDDKLQIPDVGIVDVGLSFSIGGNVGWWWGI